MKNNPKIHHRKSIRIKGYDYSQAGLYFITICCQNRVHLLGKIVNGKMVLNDAGKMIKKWYFELENKFPDIKCHAMIIMPNHFHCIVENAVGADLRVCPDKTTGDKITGEKITGEKITGEKITGNKTTGEKTTGDKTTGEHICSPLPRVVQWFKTMTTNEYIRGVKNKNWQRFDGKFWQRNYWEHIIRDENEYRRISEYIINNPMKWEIDTLNGENVKKILK